jgi:hypothetical protein
VSDIEWKVMEATNEDKWGPHGNAMKGMSNNGRRDGCCASLQSNWCRLMDTTDTKHAFALAPTTVEHGSVHTPCTSEVAEIALAAQDPGDRALIMVGSAGLAHA